MRFTELKYVKDTFPEYLGKKDHISSSDIKNFLKSPAYYYYEKFEKPKDQEEKRHFSIGSAMHEVILEPHLFKTNYVVLPKYDLRTNAGKEAAKVFADLYSSATILFEDEMEMIKKIAENASKNKTFMEIIKDSFREVSVYGTDEQTGLKVKVRPDILPEKRNLVCDLKSCINSAPNKFKYDIYSYGYNISAAFYCDVLKRENYVFGAGEKTAPHQFALYSLSDEIVSSGRSQYEMALSLIKFCQENNHWPSHNEFQVMKECYDLGNLSEYFDIISKSELITII